LHNLRAAVVAMAGVLASFGVLYAICVKLGTNPSPAILAAALAVGLARRPDHLDPRSALITFVTLPGVALAGALVGLAFRASPILGAALFVIGVMLSVWLRNFGERGRLIGRIVALPFIVMLVVPFRADPSLAPWISVLLVLCAGIVANLCTYAVHRIAPVHEAA
jgi:hypothetical protein